MSNKEILELDSLESHYPKVLAQLSALSITSTEQNESEKSPLPPTTKLDFIYFADQSGYPVYLANLTWSRLKAHFCRGQRLLSDQTITKEEHAKQFGPIKFIRHPEIDSPVEEEYVIDTRSLAETIEWIAATPDCIGATAVDRLGSGGAEFLYRYEEAELRPIFQKVNEEIPTSE